MTISVTVDGQGRLVSVSVARTWRRELSADDFAGALFARYLTAVREPLAELLTRRLEQPPPRRTPHPPATADPVEAAHAAVAESTKALESLRAAIGSAAATVEIHGARGYLTLVTRGGGAVDLVGNAPAIDKANADLLAEDAMDVFRRANLTAP